MKQNENYHICNHIKHKDIMTIYKFLILFGIISLVYCLFQLITLNYLTVTLKLDDSNSQHEVSRQEYEKLKINKLHLNNSIIINNSVKPLEVKVDGNSQLNNDKHAHTYIRGLNIKDYLRYQPNADNYFTCLKSNEKIPYSQLNDDYCDCEDGSDEPGTSACSNSIFHCDTQSEYLANHHIASLKVNDGICDCCDGSDEYGAKVKCVDTCKEKTDKAKERLQMENSARLLKKDYLIEGQHKNQKLYGPDGIFYKLSKKCYSITWTEFNYKVCPYMQVEQNKDGKSTSLGKTTYLVFENSFWTIHMSSGDSKFCEKPRSSKIILNCDIKEALKRVEEPEKCVYVFYLNTPAAC